MACLECGSMDDEKWLKNWLCGKCEDKFVKLGKEDEEAIDNAKRIQASRKKRSSN